MRELAVYYCPQCGRYGYYQLVRNAICANCGIKMSLLDMPYIEFIHLDREQRDELLTSMILKYNQSITTRIIQADRAHNTRHVVAKLNSHIQELETENKKLNETVEWMHQTIWDLLEKNKKLERKLQDSSPPKQPD